MRTRKEVLLNHDASLNPKKDHCEICSIKFNSLTKYPHKCKRCYMTVCNDCGTR